MLAPTLAASAVLIFAAAIGQRREPRTGFREGRLGRDAGGGTCSANTASCC